MSTPARSRSATSLQPTRQQLDELIELMQQMLALPESTREEELKPRLPIVTQSLPLLRPDIATPQNELTSPDLSPCHPVTLSSAPVPRTPSPVSDLLQQERPDPASVRAMSVALVPVPAPALAKPTGGEAHPERMAASDPSASVRVWLWPFVGINWVFDRCTAPLGAPGRWLRGPRGRAWLGWSGLLLLASALAGYLLLGMGWTW